MTTNESVGLEVARTIGDKKVSSLADFSWRTDNWHYVTALVRRGDEETFRPHRTIVVPEQRSYEDVVRLAKDKLRRQGFQVVDVMFVEKVSTERLEALIAEQRTRVREAREAMRAAQDGVEQHQADGDYYRAVEVLQGYINGFYQHRRITRRADNTERERS